jgi:hypothetical protein
MVLAGQRCSISFGVAPSGDLASSSGHTGTRISRGALLPPSHGSSRGFDASPRTLLGLSRSCLLCRPRAVFGLAPPLRGLPRSARLARFQLAFSRLRVLGFEGRASGLPEASSLAARFACHLGTAAAVAFTVARVGSVGLVPRRQDLPVGKLPRMASCIFRLPGRCQSLPWRAHNAWNKHGERNGCPILSVMFLARKSPAVLPPCSAMARCLRASTHSGKPEIVSAVEHLASWNGHIRHGPGSAPTALSLLERQAIQVCPPFDSGKPEPPVGAHLELAPALGRPPRVLHARDSAAKNG